jgi:hypothetical protein
MLTAVLGIAKAGMGIAGAIGGHNNAMAEAKAKNEAMMKEYKYRLQIRDKKWKDELQIYATKLGQYDLQMKAADRAASRAYGVEQYNQSERIKKAAFSTQQLNRALAKSGGAAAAAGKSGRTAQRLDLDIENTFARNQNMIAANLMSAEEVSSMNALNIQDQLQSAQNQAYGNVAIAPTTPMELLEPTQYSGPSSAGMALGIGNSILGGIGSIAGNMAPDPGNMFGGGGGGFGGFSMSQPSPVDYGIAPLTSGMNFFGP